MKTTLVALTLCSFAVVAVSGCNKPEAAAPVPAPAPTASQDASTSGQILRPACKHDRASTKCTSIRTAANAKNEWWFW